MKIFKSTSKLHFFTSLPLQNSFCIKAFFCLKTFIKKNWDYMAASFLFLLLLKIPSKICFVELGMLSYFPYYCGAYSLVTFLALSDLKNKKRSHVKISLYKLIFVGLFSILISHIIINSDLPILFECLLLYTFGLDKLTMAFGGFTVDSKLKIKSPNLNSFSYWSCPGGYSNNPTPSDPGINNSSSTNPGASNSSSTNPRPGTPHTTLSGSTLMNSGSGSTLMNSANTSVGAPSNPGRSAGNTTPTSSAITHSRHPLPAVGTISTMTLIELRAQYIMLHPAYVGSTATFSQAQLRDFAQESASGMSRRELIEAIRSIRHHGSYHPTTNPRPVRVDTPPIGGAGSSSASSSRGV